MASTIPTPTYSSADQNDVVSVRPISRAAIAMMIQIKYAGISSPNEQGAGNQPEREEEPEFHLRVAL